MNEIDEDSEVIFMTPKALLDMIEEAHARGMKAGAQMMLAEEQAEESTGPLYLGETDA